MTVAEAAFSLGADEQHPSVPVQEPFFDQVAHEGLGRSSEGAKPSPPFLPQSVSDPVLLEAEGQYLLGDDVPGLWWGRHWLHPAA